MALKCSGDGVAVRWPSGATRVTWNRSFRSPLRAPWLAAEARHGRPTSCLSKPTAYEGLRNYGTVGWNHGASKTTGSSPGLIEYQLKWHLQRPGRDHVGPRNPRLRQCGR